MNNGIDGFDIYDNLSQKLRTGWKKRGIPDIFCESVLEHSLNVERSCNSLIEGDFIKIENKDTFPLMGRYHDLLEYKMSDFTPSCGISESDKLRIEYSVLNDLNDTLGDAGRDILLLIEEYLLQKTSDSKVLMFLDKIDSGVKAFEYEKLGYNVGDFHPYVLKKIKNNKELENIYKILLEREFDSINYHIQYFILLKYAGNYNKYKDEMNKILIGS